MGERSCGAGRRAAEGAEAEARHVNGLGRKQPPARRHGDAKAERRTASAELCKSTGVNTSWRRTAGARASERFGRSSPPRRRACGGRRVRSGRRGWMREGWRRGHPGSEARSQRQGLDGGDYAHDSTAPGEEGPGATIGNRVRSQGRCRDVGSPLPHAGRLDAFRGRDPRRADEPVAVETGRQANGAKKVGSSSGPRGPVSNGLPLEPGAEGSNAVAPLPRVKLPSRDTDGKVRR